LCPATRGGIRKALGLLKGKEFIWAYYGENMPGALLSENLLQGKGRRIEIGDMLQEAAKGLRQPYLEYIGELSVNNNSKKWWFNSFSEKNPHASKVFLHACYIRALLEKTEKNKGCSILAVVENDAVKASMNGTLQRKSNIPELHYIKSFSNDIRNSFRNIAELIVRKSLFASNTCYQIGLAKRAYKKKRSISVNEKRKNILIHSWIDKRSFSPEHKYIDSYFGLLPSYLKKRGHNVMVVPWVLGKRNYGTYLKEMKLSGGEFLIPEAFLGIKDVISTTLKAALDPPAKERYPLFGGMDLSESIFENLRKDWIRTHIERNILLGKAVEGWKKSGIRIDNFIYTYENHTWEKAYCAALKEFYPECSVIGYQHSAVIELYLPYFFSLKEMDIMPFPDAVVTNGRFTEGLFLRSGYPENKVFLGGALRYSYLKEDLNKKNKSSERKKNILVTPSIYADYALELLIKVRSSAEILKDHKFTIKFHPAMPYKHIKRYLTTLPENITVSGDPVKESLKEADILIYTDSTTCIEALSKGVPVLHVASDHTVDMDPLSSFPKYRLSARSAENITKAIGVLEKDDTYTLPEEARRVLAGQLFGDTDEKFLQLFERSYKMPGQDINLPKKQ
jgi:hypothetical protein